MFRSKLLFLFLFITQFGVFGQFVHPRDLPAEKKFDFWIGEWDVDVKVRQSDGSWQSGHQSVATIYSILDGKAILELWNEGEQGILGYSLRYYNKEKGKWDLWLNWPSPNQSSMSTLEGNFNNGRGDFFSEYVASDGVKRITRYSFFDITANSLLWQDGFSRDNGETWDSSWKMYFSRKAQTAPVLSSQSKANTYYKGKRCSLTEFASINRMAGSYGHKKDVQSAKIIKVLDGCMVIGFLNTGRQNCFFTLAYDYSSEAYELTFLNDEIGVPMTRLYGQLVNNIMIFSAKEGDDSASLSLNKDKFQMVVSYHNEDYKFQLIRE
ncbi:MAG: hypothetical protein AAFN93_14325 [Bacteroidota bacterium]